MTFKAEEENYVIPDLVSRTDDSKNFEFVIEECMRMYHMNLKFYWEKLEKDEDVHPTAMDVWKRMFDTCLPRGRHKMHWFMNHKKAELVTALAGKVGY